MAMSSGVNRARASEMVQWIKTVADKPEDQSSIFRMPITQRETETETERDRERKRERSIPHVF